MENIKSLQFGDLYGSVFVAQFGRQIRLIDDKKNIAVEQAVALGANENKICKVIVASDSEQEGYQELREFNYQKPVEADGSFITEKGSAILIQSADCPIVIVINRKTGLVIVFHAGRPALTPNAQGDTVIENAIRVAKENGLIEDLEVLVLNSICGDCFKHDEPGAEEKVASFRKLGNGVFSDPSTGALDLFKVIHLRFTVQGVDLNKIRKEGSCTFETPTLASYRRDKGTKKRNTVVVVLRDQ